MSGIFIKDDLISYGIPVPIFIVFFIFQGVKAIQCFFILYKGY